jgi:hypothetical protein
MISAKVILGSEFNGKRITTFELTYPRFIHAELMTHRVLSRNSASSRAIPVKKMLKNIKASMAAPIHWGANQSGMQAKEELGGFRKWLAQKIWVTAGKVALKFAWFMDKVGAHKQIVNRIIEPWAHMVVIVTATEWDNFFELRAHPDAQPEIHELAIKMQEAMRTYFYDKLKADSWHLPYVNDKEKAMLSLFKQIQVSVARCARVSYLTHDGKTSKPENDIKLYERLVGSVPLHASPSEHQATPVSAIGDDKYQGNFVGFVQFRKLLEERMYNKRGYSKRVSMVFDYAN